MTGVAWLDTERGPMCACGLLTYVSFVNVTGGKLPVLVCFAHGGVGAHFCLPLERPTSWPNLSAHDLIVLIDRGIEEHKAARGVPRDVGAEAAKSPETHEQGAT